jgi:hypothetical protein
LFVIQIPQTESTDVGNKVVSVDDVLHATIVNQTAAFLLLLLVSDLNCRCGYGQ